jgi:PEGA domain-containing protein
MQELACFCKKGPIFEWVRRWRSAPHSAELNTTMKLTQFRPATETGGPQTTATVTSLNPDEGLGAFGSETEPAPVETPAAPESEIAKPPVGLRLRVAPGMALPLVFAALIGATVGAAALRAYQQIMLGRGKGSVRIESSTPGAEVSVAGKVVGRTPVSLSLAPGAYPVVLAGGGARRELTLDVVSGATVIRQIDMPAAAPAVSVGSLHVQTDPARQTVFVDGTERGASPITVHGLTPGEHQVAVRTDGATVRRTVTVQANENTVLVVSAIERGPAPAPAAPPATAGGWLSVTSPFGLQIREGGKLLGSTDAERIMLPAGEHALEFTNEALGFQTKRTVKIDAGKTASVKVDPPNGVLSINAQPWAEVWVDGQRIGETPIGKISTSIGQHEVVLRHPELGERRQTVTVTLRQPSRLGVDMRKK